MMDKLNIARMKSLLVDLYGETAAAHVFTSMLPAIEATRLRTQEKFNPEPLSAKDVVLITYADQFRQDDQPPLEVLGEVCQRVLNEMITTIHILPFFPYTSDDGFSVSDYRSVKPEFGEWQHIDRLGRNYRLMFDAVVNHTSVKHNWFERFLQDDPDYVDFYVTARPEDDLREVVRPRALPLLTRFRSRRGKRFVWTTFSEDQVDLNYANPAVLIEVSKVLLEYAERGAQFIRLDAIAYLWKEIGTPCIHLPQTHKIIQFWRAMFEEAAPYVRLITETNVPHEDNIAYFGDGSNEAHLVYNFALPPLVLHAMHRQNATYLTQWASGLRLPSREAMFFNFLASHDGIGLNPARGILGADQPSMPESEINWLVKVVQELKGLVGYKSNPDGSQTPYELNINYLDALAGSVGQQDEDTLVDRFLTAHAVLLSLAGLPAIYVHSLLGSRGWPEGVAQTGINRSINREKFNARQMLAELAEASSLRHKIWRGFELLLKVRRNEPAFHPQGEQQILPLDGRLFIVLRRDRTQARDMLCCHNFSAEQVEVNLGGYGRAWLDVLTGESGALNQPVRIAPFGRRWLALSGSF